MCMGFRDGVRGLVDTHALDTSDASRLSPYLADVYSVFPTVEDKALLVGGTTTPAVDPHSVASTL